MRHLTTDWRRKLCCAAIAIGAAFVPAQAEPDTDSLQQAVVHVWELTADKHIFTGSGFVVSKEGYIVTNYHVIANEQFVSVLLQGEDEPRDRQQALDLFAKGHIAQVLYYSKSRDLAILKVEPLPVTPLVITDAKLSKNMPVYAIGFPGAAEEIFRAPTADSTVTNGVIGRLYSAPLTDSGDAESIPVIQHNASINHGNSGGPLLDDCGRVIGVNTWGNSDRLTSDGQLQTSAGVFYASNSLNLIPFLRANNIPATVSSDVCSISPWQQFMQRGLMDGGVAVLLLALLAAAALAFRRPRRLVLETVNRTADAVSRRVGGKSAPSPSPAPAMETKKQAAGGPFQKLHFVGRHDAARYSFDIAQGQLQRTHSGVVLGRLSSGVDIMIENDEVSRRHARVYLDGARPVIMDLGSLNGTQVDGVKLPPDLPAPLKTGSVVRFGPLTFDVKFE